MIQCSKCGASNEDFHTVCNNCGYHLGFGDKYGIYSNTTPNGNNPNVYRAPFKTNGYAITSLVLGISSIVLICCCGVGILCGIPAIILGVIARKRILSSQRSEKGYGMALAGIITGIIGSVLCSAFILIEIVAAMTPGFWDEFVRGFKEGFEEGMNEGLQENFFF